MRSLSFASSLEGTRRPRLLVPALLRSPGCVVEVPISQFANDGSQTVKSSRLDRVRLSAILRRKLSLALTRTPGGDAAVIEELQRESAPHLIHSRPIEDPCNRLDRPGSAR